MSWDLNGFFQASKQNSMEYKVVYDIGAQKGEFAAEVKKHYPDAKIHLFEPNTKHNEDMEKFGVVHNVALWKETGVMDFYSIGESGDSFYREMTPLYDDVKPKPMPVVTLDEYVQANNLEYPDLIKLDTQGSEIDILAGGLEVLSKASAVIMEIPILAYNFPAPKTNDYIDFLTGQNYLPIGLTEVHLMDGILVQIDLAFINMKRGTK